MPNWSVKKYITIIASIVISVITADQIIVLLDRIEQLESDIQITMEFTVLQADQIDLLKNKCSESAEQIAYMCNQCTEQYKTDLTQEVLIKEELELR